MKIQPLFPIAMTLVATACASPKQAPLVSSRNSEPVYAPPPEPTNIVVKQIGSKKPLLSKYGDRHWMQLSEAEESSPGKLFGQIAVGDWQVAIQEARRNLEKHPGDQTYTVILGAAFASGKNFEMAGYYGEQVLKNYPQNTDAMNLVGLRIMMSSENRRSDYDEALSWFRKAAEGESTHVAGLLNMGHLQLDLGDANGASESFAQASSRCEKCFDAQYGYGVAQARNLSWNNARITFEDILSKDPHRAEALYQLALVFKNGLNNPKQAAKLLQEIVSDADGRYANASEVKRVANITLRRLKATDRSAPLPEESIMPRGGEMPARVRDGEQE